MWLTLSFIGVTLLSLGMAVTALFCLPWMRRLPSLASLPAQEASGGTGSVRCSVVIAARDEAARIQGTVRHLLAQRDVDAEFIVVDDRSTDGTGDVLRHMAQSDGRLKVQRVDVLPEGWLGKCYACHIGAKAATGDWILFTDGDCWLQPDVIARALRLAEREGVDHITLTPGTVVESLGARAWHILFLVSLVDWFAGVNRDRPKAYLGIGAFNLVRAAAYRGCGGYEALRLTVVDDMKLGLLLRRAGKKTRAFLGVNDVECHWGNTVGSMIRIMEKNYFAFANFKVGLVLAGSLATLLVMGLLLAGLLSGTAAGLIAGLSPLALIIPGVIVATRLGWPWTSAVPIPFMVPVFLYALLNSTWVTLRHGGIRWRETFYPLATLRAGMVR